MAQADTVWRPRPSTAGWLGLGAVTLLGLAALASALFAVRQPVGFGMFVSLLVGLVFAALAVAALVLTIGYFTLRYRFEPGALVVTWLGRRDVIPYGRVDGIFAGPRLGQAMRVRGLNWPGYHVGIGRTRAMGLVRYYVTTGNLGDVALVVTPEMTYAFSPADANGFRRELIRRVEESDDLPIESLVAAGRPAASPVRGAVRDLSLPGFLLASLLVLGVTLLYIWLKWSGLPETIPLHFNRDGVPDLWGPREDIFRIPGIGIAMLIANTGLGLAVYGREPAAARMLWGTSLMVQLLVLVATARILH
ncbi:MAG: PH domain-containing protein [Chloroflexota bacterium]|nr:PH domain-containing protein [Chloroflexota bacterium]